MKKNYKEFHKKIYKEIYKKMYLLEDLEMPQEFYTLLNFNFFMI